MRTFLIAVAVAGLVAAVSGACTQAGPSAAPSADSAAPSIEGAWKTIQVVNTATNSTQNPPASIVIYTKTHYSIVEMNNPRQFPPPAPPKDADKLTDAEKLARYEDWLAVTANSGTYEVKGNTLTRRPLVSKASPGPEEKTYPDAVRELRFEGNDTMIQVVKQPDGKNETRRTYTRLE